MMNASAANSSRMQSQLLKVSSFGNHSWMLLAQRLDRLDEVLLMECVQSLGGRCGIGSGQKGGGHSDLCVLVSGVALLPFCNPGT